MTTPWLRYFFHFATRSPVRFVSRVPLSKENEVGAADLVTCDLAILDNRTNQEVAMRVLSQQRSSAGYRLSPRAPLVTVYVEFLRAHERAAACGQPLLTAAGIDFLKGIVLSSRGSQPGNSSPQQTFGNLSAGNEFPVWDADARQLWFRGRLVKEFRQPAPHQTRLLDVFQEQGWANRHIDDPLPLCAGEQAEDAKARPHDTVKNLNRGLAPGTIRFRGDGTGQGVTWHYDGLE
jgi:hypothetical protein